MATGSKGTGLSVQDPAKAKESQNDEWLDAIAMTPIEESPVEETVAAVEPTVTQTEELATESAPVARPVLSSAEVATDAVSASVVASVAVEHPVAPVQDDAGELIAVQGEDSVVAIVPRNCEDAIE
jgi:hypothetical protein